MRRFFLILLSSLVGCSSGQFLPPKSSHEGASIITSSVDFAIWMRPSFGFGGNVVGISQDQTIWVTEGDFLIRDCYAVLDGATPEEHVHVLPGRHYLVGCDKDSRATFTDIGAAPH